MTAIASRRTRRSRRSQRGTAAIEFALAASLFFTVFFGVIEFCRMVWTWNAATEATRLGARVAAVCSMNDPTIRRQMRGRLGVLQDENIVVDYLSNGADNTCDASSCTAVRVSLRDFRFDAAIPFVPVSVAMPSFSTTLRREAMSSAGNAVCR